MTAEASSGAPLQLPIAVGSTFAGRYRILQHLASGETSHVCKAEDLLAGQIVALKLIQPELLRERKQVERFKQELRQTFLYRVGKGVKRTPPGHSQISGRSGGGETGPTWSFLLLRLVGKGVLDASVGVYIGCV